MIKVNLLKDTTNVGIKKDGTFSTKISEGTRIAGTSENKDVMIKMGIPLGMILLSMGLLSYQESAKKAELEALQKVTMQKGSEVQALGPEIEAVGNFKKEKERLQVQIDTIKTLSKERLRNVKALEALQALIPDKTWLTTMKVMEGKVEFEGMAVDDKDVADFMAALEENIYFSNVKLIKTSELQNKDGAVKAFVVESSMEGL